MAADLDVIAATRLRHDGQRYTPNRRELVHLLQRADQPLTIPEVLAQRPDLAQSSVYRNLAVLERVGVVQKVHSTDEWARFELAEDLTHHHHHLICSRCGVVRDVTLPAPLEGELDHALDALAGDHGFVVDHHRLDLVGRCDACV